MLTNPLVLKTLQQVAKSIASILNVEIMILDDKLQKVGGTVTRDRDYNISNIYHHIMKTGEIVFIENPGANKLCLNCRLFGKCPETIEFDFPIKFNEKTIGIISVVGYTDEHKRMILERKDAYHSFISTMSEMITTKIQEVIVTEKQKELVLQMEQIFSTVSEGLISTDEKGKILYCSVQAESFLSLNSSDLLGTNIRDYFSDINKVWKQHSKIKEFTNVELTIIDKKKNEKSCYVTCKPINDENKNIVGILFKLFDTKEVKSMIHNFMGFDQNSMTFSDIIGNSVALTEAKNQAQMVSRSSSTVLIFGESGTGKELFARAIHNMSLVSSGPFVAINCAAIPESLLESELFGYEAGAFTGAKREGKPGKFELADGGTIFLDEIGDMPIYLQSKILRVLEDRNVQRIGGIKEKKVSVRIISATNKDIEKMVKENRFREDLFYRLNVIPIKIPPLRERKEDFDALTKFFLNHYNRSQNKSVLAVDSEVINLFCRYSWPGNVRELENVMEYSMMMESTNKITLQSLPKYLLEEIENHNLKDRSLKEQVAVFEKELIKEKIALFGGGSVGRQKAAEVLDIGVATLYRKIK